MAEGSEDTATIAQKILYSGLPNQCRKCRRFGHHARAYNTSRIKPREGAPTLNPSNFRGENGKKSGGARALHPGNAQADKQL
jgi:ribosomal protein S14